LSDLAAGRAPVRAAQGERHSVKQQLDSLVTEMVDKGILFDEARREFEKRFIARVLQRHRGNLSRAAKDLRIHRNTLGKKIEQYKLPVRGGA
jgi:Fis family transcriptional regulator, factor for inversion stimulation protein